MSTNLQRSSSAPHTVAGLAQKRPAAQLPRTKSHLHVEKQQPQPKLYLKPLTAAVPPALASSSSEREDPFNLAGFFPPSDEKASWRWLREEPEQIMEEPEALEDESEDEESPEEAIRRADVLGILSLFSSTKTAAGEDDYDVYHRASVDGEPQSYDSLHETLVGRRREATELM